MEQPKTQTMWDKCQQVSDTPKVNEVIEDFLEDPHNDSGVEMIRTCVETYLEIDKEAKMQTLKYMMEKMNETITGLVDDVLENSDELWEQSQPKNYPVYSLLGVNIYLGETPYGWTMYGLGWKDLWFLGFSIKS